MFTALAAPAFAGSKHLLTFTYQCDVPGSHESLDDVTTTMKINGGIWDGDEVCQKFIPAGTIDLSGCQARRTARSKIVELVEKVGKKKVVPIELDLAILGFGQDASGELYVMANETGVPFGAGPELDQPTGVVLKIVPQAE